METLLPVGVQAALLAFLTIGFLLNRFARARPDIGWLQAFKRLSPPMSEAQQARRRRTADIIAALQMILAGMVLPVLYMLSNLLLFSSPSPTATVLVTAASAACIVLGLWVLLRGR